MRSSGLALLIALGACTGDENPYGTRVYEFGPYTVNAQEDIIDQCVQITLHNDEPIYVNAVELTTGPGFHHSNWFYVPEHIFPGDDGTYTCDDRAFSLATAAIFGGVFFAQSTQSTHEIQSFPTGKAIRVPPHFKLVSQIHLFNPGDEPITSTPKIALTSIDPKTVETTLAGISFEYHPLSLAPRMQSSFSVDCDISALHQMSLGTDPDFHIYYALAHYHKLGTQLTMEAVKPDNTAAVIYTTQGKVGDALGGTLSPPFDMTGYTRFRLTCNYYNNTDSVVYYGNGAGEMCVFLGFSDSPFNWGGGSLAMDNPDWTTGTNVNGVMTYTRGCEVFHTEVAL